MGNNAVPGAEALGEYVEVVAVKMHGVKGCKLVVDDEAHGGVGAEVVDRPVGVRVGEIACVGEGEDGVASD